MTTRPTLGRLRDEGGRDRVMEAAFAVLGSRLRVRTDLAFVGAHVGRLLAPFTCEPAAVPGTRDLALVSGDGDHGRLVADGEVLHRSGSWPALISRLVSEVNRIAIDAAPAFAVHAGVVARGRHAVAFPGTSGTGKSTLTAACLLAGFAYASDEALCIDYETGGVLPYPKPLALSQETCRLLGLDEPGAFSGGEEETLFVAAELSAATAAEPLELAHIVIPERNPGDAELRRLPAAEGMTALLRHSFNHYRRPLDAFNLASVTSRGAVTWNLRWSDPLAAARLLRDRLSTASA